MLCQNPDCGNYAVISVYDSAFDEWFPVCQHCADTDYSDAPVTVWS